MRVRDPRMKTNQSNQSDERYVPLEAISDSGLPKAFWEFQADTYSSDPRALKECSRYLRMFAEARKRNLGLFIRGPEESQKTFLGSYLLRALILEGVAARYVSMPDLVDEAFNREFNLKDFLRAAEFLVLDNVNVPASTFWPTLLNRVLTQRKDDGNPTVVITQLGMAGRDDQFKVKYGDANARLIEHLSHTVWVECDERKKLQAETVRKDIFTEEV
jgi:DNA replication protein DnaC